MFGSNEPDKAEAALQKAIEINKNDANAFLLLARIQAARGSVDKAAANYERLMQENPRDVRPVILLGTLEESRGSWQRAQALYLKALQVQPDYPVAANNLAYLLLEHGGNTDVALSYAQLARRGLPDAVSVADTLAWAYCNKGSYRLAIDLLEDSVKKAPSNATYQYHLGMAYQGIKDRTRAKQHLDRALQLDPNFAKSNEVRKALAELAAG
jgi:tetratricopeptide (TPR) repeat protein